MKFHAGPELDRHFLAVGGGLMRQRKLRHDVELFVDVEQLVAQCGKHDAADEGARQRRIEDVRVFGQAEAQLLGMARRCGKGRDHGDCGADSGSGSHRCLRKHGTRDRSPRS